MKASERIKAVLKDKHISVTKFAEMIDKPYRTVYNTLVKDGAETDDGNMRSMKFSTVEEWLDVLDCDIVLRDRATGKIYE